MQEYARRNAFGSSRFRREGQADAARRKFYIDVAVCMSCSFCVEFCPFDAIKMNHDYELAVYDRYPQLVYNKAELTVPLEYYAALANAVCRRGGDARPRKRKRRKAAEKACGREGAG